MNSPESLESASDLFIEMKILFDVIDDVARLNLFEEFRPEFSEIIPDVMFTDLHQLIGHLIGETESRSTSEEKRNRLSKRSIQDSLAERSISRQIPLFAWHHTRREEYSRHSSADEHLRSDSPDSVESNREISSCHDIHSELR